MISGFESGGQHSPALIAPWDVVGDEKSISITAELSSCFERNKVALRRDVLCDKNCPKGGVGVYNPGYWGMNIQQGKTYNVVFYVRTSGPMDLAIQFTSADGQKLLAYQGIKGRKNLEKDGGSVESYSGRYKRKASIDSEQQRDHMD
ncbi:aspartate-semialdehyde dehydrogenase-like protein [Ancistrocladus abbreviatus]